MPTEQGPRERTVVVAWDRSAAAEEALAWATDYARTCLARVVVVHVLDPSTVAISDDVVNEEVVQDAGEAILRARRAEVARAAGRHGVGAQVEVVVSGRVPEALAKAIEDHAPDLVCMGTRGRGAVARLALGSTADWVVHRCGVPVVLFCG